MMRIYKITNKVNGHSYIGQSVDIEKRWKSHKKEHIAQLEKNMKKLYTERLKNM